MIRRPATTRRARSRLALALAALLAPGALLPPECHAFRLAAREARHGPNHWPTPGRPILHWDLREFPDCRVRWTFGRITGDVAAATAAAELTAAFDAWEQVDPSRLGFQLTGHGTPPPVPFEFDGYNTVAWNDTLTDRLMGSRIPIPAMTMMWYVPATGRMLEADIRLNDRFQWDVASHDQEFLLAPRRCDIRTIAIHEVGHFIGLDHTTDDLGDWDVNAYPSTDFPGPGDTDRNGDGAFEAPVMSVENEVWTRRQLHDDDRDGCNFLHDPDLGDAPDPWLGTFNDYPSFVHGPGPPSGVLNGLPRYEPARGADHLFGVRPRQRNRNYTYEWLGKPAGNADDLDGECETEQVDRDAFDDGVTLVPNPALYRRPVRITDWYRWANDAAGRGHDYAAHPLKVNTWIDLDQDGTWEPGERAIHHSDSPAPPAGPNAHASAKVETSVVLPDALANSPRPMWLRTRLDWGEDVGDAERIDPTLSGPKGAAQFGEVEDYPITMVKPKRQWIFPLVPPTPMPAVRLVLPGPTVPGTDFARQVTPDDCPVAPFGGPPVASYDPLVDESTFTYAGPGGIPPGGTVHVGRDQADAPAHALRATWVPPSGSPGIEHLLPVTNATVWPATMDGEPVTEILVGTANAEAGGAIGTDPESGAWTDSMFVEVTARFAPAPVALENLSLCDPAVAGLVPLPLGGAWITPGSPFRASASPPALPSGTRPETTPGTSLILEVRSHWSVNANTATELYEVELAGAAADVGMPSRPAAGFGLRSFPTPSSSGGTLSFRLPRAARVSLALLDVSGSLRRTLMRGEHLAAGDVRRPWFAHGAGGDPLPAGVYFLRLEVDGETEAARVVIRR